MTDSIRLAGQIALKQWAKWAYDRGPDWPTSCSIHRALYGRGGVSSAMPADVEPIDHAVGKLSPLIKSVVRTYYAERHKHWRQHAKELQISRRNYQDKLIIGETQVGQFLG